MSTSSCSPLTWLPIALVAWGPAYAAEAQQPAPVFGSSFLTGTTPPKSLAADALGVGGDAITEPGSPVGLAAAIFSGISPSGDLKGAAGLQFSPFTLGWRTDIFQYQANTPRRIISNTNFSVAWSESKGDNDPGGVAVGVGTTLWNRGDMFTRRLDTGQLVMERCLAPAEGMGVDLSDLPEEDEETDVPQPIIDVFASCANTLREAAWNDLKLSVGFVTVAKTESNNVAGLQNSNNVAYLTFTYGFEGLSNADQFTMVNNQIKSGCSGSFSFSCNAELIVQARYESDATLELPDLGVKNAELTTVGVKLAAGTSRAIAYAYYLTKHAEFDVTTRNVSEYGLGVETRIGDSYWFSVVVGRNEGEIVQPDTKVKATVSWDLSSTPRFLNPF